MSGEVSEADGVGPQPEDSPGLPFLVVGVGASAGGLEAFTELLKALPSKPGLALLVVSHLDPAYKSELPTLLSRVSQMPVHEVTQGMAVEADNVYVLPPGASMAMTDGHLNLTPRPPRPVVHMPIDHLLRSLAEIQKARSVAVILSGNGSDGVIALQAIKAAGGVTFAQDEESAQYPGLPRAAAQDGGVDHVMRPSEIANELMRIAGHPYTRHAEAEAISTPTILADDPIADILSLLRQRMGVDFTHYKQATVRRRIFRRMALRNLHDPADYLSILRAENIELTALYQDLLIRVTQFFRDPEAFESLKQQVFPSLVNGRPDGSVIRIWVAGCATGEEVYSLAISLLEYLNGREEHLSIKILATDLNETALEKARTGVYLDNIEIDVTADRLRRFFVRHEGHYQISKAIRELCVFARHDLTADPPYSRIDLLSCRNVLIYMDSALQKRVFPLLHYALSPGGFLFLGLSENVNVYNEFFEVVDAKHRIFSRRQTVSGVPIEFDAMYSATAAIRPRQRDESSPLWNALDVQREADRVLLSRFAPVGVVIDEAMTVLQFRGRTAAYLEPAPGLASLDLLRMLRDGLMAEVRSAIIQAKAENAVAVRERLQVVEENAIRSVRVEVIPFKVPPSGVRFFLVLFQDAEPIERLHQPSPAPRLVPDEDQVNRLQHELASMREYLQSVIEEQESTNEELKSANEEILSANEELQSTNEELQTAKEEAQSANEELATVNEELRSRNAELARVNADVMNLIGGVNIPIVMVGRDLRVRRITPQAEKLFNLIPSDIGRPISDFRTNLQVDNLPGLIAGVIESITPYERAVQDTSKRWHSLRIRPYITVDNKIDGASVVLVDIDAVLQQFAARDRDPRRRETRKRDRHFARARPQARLRRELGERRPSWPYGAMSRARSAM
jgi:two-component system CheB/CheR fusion protein